MKLNGVRNFETHKFMKIHAHALNRDDSDDEDAILVHGFQVDSKHISTVI